jgi:hypothetical protein
MEVARTQGQSSTQRNLDREERVSRLFKRERRKKKKKEKRNGLTRIPFSRSVLRGFLHVALIFHLLQYLLLYICIIIFQTLVTERERERETNLRERNPIDREEQMYLVGTEKNGFTCGVFL